tara:strand:+ start:134 stop:409 length:276 start_codon:yes stop_codon:yes gene_type:complete
MFGRKKKCKQCGKELIRPEDKMNGKWCEVCTIDVLGARSINLLDIEPGTDEWHNLTPEQKIAWYDEQEKDLNEKMKDARKKQKQIDELDDD